MNPWVLPLALFCGLALAGTALGLFVLWRAHYVVQELDQKIRATQEHGGPDMDPLWKSVEALAARVRELERNPPGAEAPGAPRHGLNLCKRSQALRMHRQGEASDQIAQALALPRQEVDLLLKVHRIVISNV